VTSVEYFIHDAEADTSSHVIAAYINAYTQPNDLVVDPFCRSPAVITTALQLERRVIAVNLNPLRALENRLALTPCPARDLDGAVTRLADSLKFDTPLREHLQRLYRTQCRQCAAEAVADYFIWEYGQDLPSQVSYHCSACNASGVRDCDDTDFGVVRAIQPRGLHYWYVLDRIARQQDEEARRFAAQLLELYTPRNLYALSNLVLRAEDLVSDSLVLDFVRLALLQCLQRGSKLNGVPGEPTPSRVGRLQPLPRFVERNVWTLFDDAVSALQRRQPAIVAALAAQLAHVATPPLIDDSRAPAEPARAFAGHTSVRKLCAELPPRSVGCIVTQPPQLGRKRWALDYLWTGWLYGYEESAPLWPLVRHRSSDWPWYLRAMEATLSALQDTLKTDGHVTFMGRAKPLAYCESLLLAAAAAELRLETALYQPTEAERATKPFSGQRGEYRLTWTVGAPTPPWPMPSPELLARLQSSALDAVEETLAQRGEPTAFARLHCCIWQALAKQGLLQRLMSAKDILSPLTVVRQQVRTGLQDGLRTKLKLLPDQDTEDASIWWLVQPPEATPLAERVERSTDEMLQTAKPAELSDLLTSMYMRFPGALTPSSDWALACLRSYARQEPSGLWVLKDEDRVTHRERARAELTRQLEALGQRLGYKASKTPPFDALWTESGMPRLGWVILDSAALGQLVGRPAQATDHPPMRRIAVVFETRQDLLRFRLARSQWLRQQLSATTWRFVTDRNIREWATQQEVTLADLDSLVGADPLSIQDRSQLSLM
jgi:hypothetical protein